MGMSSKEVHDDGRQNKLLQATTLLGFQKPRKEEEEVQNSMEKLDCPRCGSQNTKFCYYNNYNKSQPRHFCKSCKRHWTKGGTLRDVPVGGGRNKNKRIKIASKPQGKTGKTLNPQKSNNFSSKSDRPIGCSNRISLFPDPVSAAESTLPGNDHQDLKYPFQFSDLFSLDANPCSFQTSAVGCSFNGEITEDTNADIGTYSWDWHDINGLVSGEFSFSFPDSENNR